MKKKRLLKPGEFIAVDEFPVPPEYVEDNINPDHYKVGGIETFDYIKAKLSPTQLAGFCKGNIIKYISRAEHKNKVEDLKKAKWYLDTLIIELEKHD